jgi:hypothetical protein
VEEKQSMMSGVIQYIHFGEKRRRDNTHFGREKEHVRRLLVPTQRGDRMMQWRVQHPKSGNVWIDLRWKTISQISWVERLFAPDIVVEIKQATKVE